MNELKPCLFCGGKAKMVTRVTQGFPKFPLAYVECEKCMATTQTFADFEGNGEFVFEVARMWNKRAGEQDE